MIFKLDSELEVNKTFIIMENWSLFLIDILSAKSIVLEKKKNIILKKNI